MRRAKAVRASVAWQWHSCETNPPRSYISLARASYRTKCSLSDAVLSFLPFFLHPWHTDLLPHENDDDDDEEEGRRRRTMTGFVQVCPDCPTWIVLFNLSFFRLSWCSFLSGKASASQPKPTPERSNSPEDNFFTRRQFAMGGPGSLPP